MFSINFGLELSLISATKSPLFPSAINASVLSCESLINLAKSCVDRFDILEEEFKIGSLLSCISSTFFV